MANLCVSLAMCGSVFKMRVADRLTVGAAVECRKDTRQEMKARSLSCILFAPCALILLKVG